ncbi:MAG: ArsC/Spx/MgsR family protein [Pseudomonadota bacterium]
MPKTLYGLKNCDTCKKALKALAGENVTFVDIRAEADLAAKVPVWFAALGADALLNKRSTTWRNLDEAARTGDPEALLIANPTLIKRPIIEDGQAISVGWPPK